MRGDLLYVLFIFFFICFCVDVCKSLVIRRRIC